MFFINTWSPTIYKHKRVLNFLIWYKSRILPQFISHTQPTLVKFAREKGVKNPISLVSEYLHAFYKYMTFFHL